MVTVIKESRPCVQEVKIVRSFSKAQRALPDTRQHYYSFCLFLISIDKSLEAASGMNFSDA